MLKFFNVMLAMTLVSVAAFAGSSIAPRDAYQVRYAANLSAGQSVVNLTNAGTVSGVEPAGNICANVYVFAEDQQLIACCACELTPNHLQTLSVQNDLISNTLTPGVPIGVTVGLVATAGAGCNPSTVSAGSLAPGLRAWGTTLHAAPGGGFFGSETAFSFAELSATELQKMTQLCGFIQANGSGYGICGSCKVGAAGAVKQ
jgi:hypothetical protein